MHSSYPMQQLFIDKIIKDLEFIQRLFRNSGLHIINTGIEKTYCDIILLDRILQYTDISIILHTPTQ